jgi:hypothetical protein
VTVATAVEILTELKKREKAWTKPREAEDRHQGLEDQSFVSLQKTQQDVLAMTTKASIELGKSANCSLASRILALETNNTETSIKDRYYSPQEYKQLTKQQRAKLHDMRMGRKKKTTGKGSSKGEA